MQGGPGSVTLWGWNGLSGSGFWFWRLFSGGLFLVFQYSLTHTINTKSFAIKKILRGINFVKITKIFSSVDPESGHSCWVLVQYPRRNEFP